MRKRIEIILICIMFIGVAIPQTELINQVKADPGDVIQSFDSPGEGSWGLAWDGQYLWNVDRVDKKIYKLTTSGVVLDSFDSPGDSPLGLVWDGQYLWNMEGTGKIYKITTSGEIVYSCDYPGRILGGLAYDGSYLWNTDAGSNKIYKLTTTGIIVDSFDSPGEIPVGLTWENGYLWNADLSGFNHTIYKLDPADGNILFSFDSPGEGSWGLTWDGSYLWASDPWLDKIYKIDVGENGGESDIIIDEISGGFGISATIINTGTTTANNINWSIDVNADIGLILSESDTEDVIDEIGVNETVKIQANTLRGIGLITMTIQAGDVEKQATAFLLGPLVLRVIEV